MPVERRGQAIAFEIGSTGNGRNPIFNGRRQPSSGGTSRMNREVQVRICEGLGVQFPGPTRPTLTLPRSLANGSYFQQKADLGDRRRSLTQAALSCLSRWPGIVASEH